MSNWSLYRPLGGIALPKLVLSSGLAFLGGLAFDRLTFEELMPKWKVIYLSCFASAFLVTENLKTFAAIGLPFVIALRRRFLAPGGFHLLISIGFFAESLSAAFQDWRRKRTKNLAAGHDENPILVMVIALHQLGCWYLVPRANSVWHRVSKLLDSRQGIWWWLSSGLLVVWLFWDVSVAVFKIEYPGTHTLLVQNLWERPLHSAHFVRKATRRSFDRFIFKKTRGEPPLYEYSSLNREESEIRLLKLHAAHSWNIVEASLLSVSVSELPSFEAISYRWCCRNEIPILLNGRRFLVSSAVHDIFRALRSDVEDRWIWIDSVCINQSDDAEKSWQIRLMRQIYRSADRVIGCLRPHIEIPLLPGSLSSIAELVALLDSDNPKSADDMSQALLYGDLHTKFRSATILLCNEFFFRTWIVQEVALARKFVLKLGQEEVEWNDNFVVAARSFGLIHEFYGSITHFSVTINERTAYAISNIHNMEELRSSIVKKPDGLPLSELLVTSLDFECSDPRDRIFGILGLSTIIGNTSRDVVAIDYEEYDTESKLSIRATRYILFFESSFQLIELAGIGYKPLDPLIKQTDRPSWVPRWNSAQISQTKVLIATSNKYYNAATYMPLIVVDQDGPSGLLKIQGVFVDKIQTLSPAWAHLDIFRSGQYLKLQEHLDLISGFLDLLERMCQIAQGQSKDTNENLNQNVVWRTMCHDSRRGRDEGMMTIDEVGRQVQDRTKELREILQIGTELTNKLNIMRLKSIMVVLSSHLSPLLGRRLCVTSQGRLGIVPPYAQEGDQIWVLSGAPNPFVLRPSTETTYEKGEHQHVGVCYLDGIMHGELEGSGKEACIVALV